MSNHTSAPHTDRPSAPQPTPSTDRPTATYPTALDCPRPAMPAGWRVDPRPGRYLDPADPADAPRLAQADATPTGVFPTRRSIRPAGRPRHEGGEQADAASTARTRPGTRACHTPAAPSTEPSRPEPTDGRETPIQDMGRPGILARPSMAWHPSLMQLAIGAALVLALLGACNVAAIQAHRQARAYCHALVVSDWDRAQRECRGTGEGTPQPEQVPGAPSQPPAPAPADAPALAAEWTVHGTDSPYDRTDPHASPLDLPRCTTAPDTPMPCLAHVSADSAHVTVLEEDASLTGLDRR